MKKRGSHIEIGLSFALFIIALIYLIAILISAIEKSEDKQYVLDKLKGNLLEDTYEKVSVFSLDVGGINPNKDCIKIQNPAEELLSANLIIKDKDGNIKEYGIKEQNLVVRVGAGFSGSLRFYSSDIFLPGGYNGEGCEPVIGDSLNRVMEKTYRSETKMFSLTQRYESDYENLKKDFKIPEGTDFSFAFTFGNGTIVETGNVLSSESIYVDEDIFQYINSNGEVNIGFITIKVW